MNRLLHNIDAIFYNHPHAPHRHMEFLKQHITKKRVSCRQWQQLLGSLRSSAPALYGV